MLRRGMVLLLIAGTVSARADAPAPNLPAVPEGPPPPTPPARYNRASVLVTKGEPKRGLAVLAQFRVAGCDKCRQRLRDAQAGKGGEPPGEEPGVPAGRGRAAG